MKRIIPAVGLVLGLLSLTTPTWRGGMLCAGPMYKEVDVSNGGTVRGVVRLVGNPSKARQLDITKDADYCGRRKASPRLCVGRKNGVQHAVVSLEGIEQGKMFRPGIKPVLDQRRCNYEPHVMVFPMGEQLEIVNSDPILHNVHAYDEKAESRTIFNIAQPIKGQRTLVKSTRMLKPGAVLTTCDAGHPWMSSYIVVAEHPYYAVTDADGNFTLENVPPGTYRIRMWHEGVEVTNTELENGKVKKYYYEDPYVVVKEVTVPAKGIATVDFDLSLR
jgi:plastocyanin